MEILYLLFIAPLEMIMRWIMEQSYHLTHSYGISIIILSIFVNMLLLPLYHMAEKWQNSERDIQARMKEYNHFIKKSFKKQERYVMLKEMYRIFDYHPIMALRTSVGLLIQVPFFFSAYHLLSHYSILNGQHFVFFSNLFKPDQLISIGGLHVNVMPVLMTVINLVSAYIYTTNLQKKDKIQLWVLAILFLGILYNSPVALVLYWTLNNIFSLLKNIVYQNISKIHFSHKFNLHKHLMEYNNLKSTIVDKLFISLCFLTMFFTIMCISGLLINIHVYVKPFHNDISMSVVNPASALLIFTTLAYYLFYLFETFTKSPPVNYLTYIKTHKTRSVIALVTIIVVVLSAVNLFQATLYHTHHHDIHSRNAFFMMMAIYILNAPFIYHFLKAKMDSAFPLKYNNFFHTLLLAIAIYICCYIPISLMTNDSSFFRLSPHALLTLLLPLVSLIVMGGFCLNKIIIKPFFKHSSLFLSLSMIVLFAFSFINLNYGVMNDKLFTNSHPLYNALNIPFDMVFAFVIFFLMVNLTSSRLYKYINKLPVILSVLMIAITIYHYHGLQKMFSEDTSTALPPQQNDFTAFTDKNKLIYTNNTMNFSKTHKNIIVFILDGFDGRYIQGMIDDKMPAIQQLSGFTYYANTVSSANATYQGYGSILGGYKYSPYYISHHHYSLMQGYQDLYNKMLRFYQSHNFETSLVHPQWYTPFLDYPNTSHCEHNPLVDNCLSDFRTKANYSLLLQQTYFHNIMIPKQKSYQNSNKLLAFKLSLFKISPLSFKQIIYNNGGWMVKSPIHVSEKTKFIASIPYISTTSASKATFKVVHSMVSHASFNLNPKTCLFNSNNVTLNQPYPHSLPGKYKNESLTNPKANYFDDVCAIKFIANFVHWLKDKQIYHNTKIVLVSEHDYTTNPLKLEYYRVNKHMGSVGRPYALLMVKDFNNNTTQPLTIDTTHFMATYDTPAILCDGLVNCSKAYGKNFTRENTHNRTIITSLTPGQPKENYKDHYKIFNQVFITDNIFHMENYHKVKD